MGLTWLFGFRPHIRLLRGSRDECGLHTWVAFGPHSVGCGYSPAEAYAAWKHGMKW